MAGGAVLLRGNRAAYSWGQRGDWELQGCPSLDPEASPGYVQILAKADVCPGPPSIPVWPQGHVLDKCVCFGGI